MEIDLEVVRSTLIAGLPTRALWLIHGTPLLYNFSIAQQELAPLPPDAIQEDAIQEDAIQEPDPEWMKAQSEFSRLLIFGEYDYDGGAHPWLGLRQSDGSVYGLDVEVTPPLFLLNSSIEQFIATFTLLHRFLNVGEPLPYSIDSDLSALDPHYSVSDWRGFVDSVMNP